MNAKKIKIIESVLKSIMVEQSSRMYYVKYSSWFDTHRYDENEISKAIKSVGIKDISIKRLGGANQPAVVVFRAKPSQIEQVETALKDNGIQWPIIHTVSLRNPR